MQEDRAGKVILGVFGAERIGTGIHAAEEPEEFDPEETPADSYEKSPETYSDYIGELLADPTILWILKRRSWENLAVAAADLDWNPDEDMYILSAGLVRDQMAQIANPEDEGIGALATEYIDQEEIDLLEVGAVQHFLMKELIFLFASLYGAAIEVNNLSLANRLTQIRLRDLVVVRRKVLDDYMLLNQTDDGDETGERDAAAAMEKKDADEKTDLLLQCVKRSEQRIREYRMLGERARAVAEIGDLRGILEALRILGTDILAEGSERGGEMQELLDTGRMYAEQLDGGEIG